MSESSQGADPRDRLKRELTLVDATFLVIANVIGAGIFFTPGRVAELLPDPRWFLLAWVVGGLLSLAGALANAELGAMYPRAGGDYVYLREGIHPVAGFMVGWLSFFAIYAGTIAALAAAAAETLRLGLGWGSASTVPLAVVLIAGVSIINMIGVRWGARVNNLASFVKLVALAAFCLLGPSIGEGDFSRLLPKPGSHAPFSLVAIGMAMSPVLFSYLGWNASVYVASEIRNPGRNVPASLFLGLGICACVDLMVNCVYLYELPMEAMGGVGNAGEVSATALFGPVGGSLVGIFVLISIFGTLNATALVGPRIAYAMALDGLFFGGVEKVHETYRTPAAAIAIQGVIASAIIVLLRNFPSALDFTTFAIVIATSGDMIALFRLRRLQPDRPRPYRAWGYPLVPGLYLGVNIGVAAALVWGSPFECAVGALMLALGWPAYWFFSARKVGAPPR